jgi:hypothetical protein
MFITKSPFPLQVSRAQEIGVLELKPFDAEAFKSKLIDYAGIAAFATLDF